MSVYLSFTDERVTFLILSIGLANERVKLRQVHNKFKSKKKCLKTHLLMWGEIGVLFAKSFDIFRGESAGDGKEGGSSSLTCLTRFFCLFFAQPIVTLRLRRALIHLFFLLLSVCV